MSTTSIVQISTTDTTSSSAMAISDADSSELVEAVTALKMCTPSSVTIPSVTTPSAKAIAAIDQGGADSGYASKSTSQSSTPDSSKGAFTDGGAVVSRTRLPWGLPRRTKIKLIPFDKPIPRLTQNRFEDLRELHADGLNKLTRGLPRCRGILMSLKVFGESESTAAPWIFIQCDKVIAGKVRGFFKQPTVQLDFNPPNPDAYTPKFGIYVHEMPPTALHGKSSSSNTPSTNIHGHETIEVYCQQDAISTFGSLCGVKISASTYGKERSATIGGLLSIRGKDGRIQMVGITAGHFLTAEQYDECQADREDLEKDDEDEFDDGFSDDDVFELDLNSFEIEAPTISEPGSTQDERSESFESTIGHVYMSSQDDLQDQPNLDWVLFTIEDRLLHLPNVVTKHKITGINFVSVSRDERNVVLTTAVSGSVSGILSGSWSYLMLAPGRSLVKTNLLTLSDKKALQPGDSGAWVVDEITNEVYGHVVASDVFGRAYVVPIKDIFEDIKRRCPLDTVDLPLENPISEPLSDITTHSVGTLAFSHNDEQRANSHNVPMGSSPEQPPRSDTAELKKAILGPDHWHYPPASSTPQGQKNARDAISIAPSFPTPSFTSSSNRFQNDVGSPSSPTQANLADLNKAVGWERLYPQQPYRVSDDSPLMPPYIHAYPPTHLYDLNGVQELVVVKGELDEPYVDSGYCTVNGSPTPSQPHQLTQDVLQPQQFQVLQSPPNIYQNTYYVVNQPGKASDSFSPDVLNRESDPLGESRFQRFKAKVGQLWKKT